MDSQKTTAPVEYTARTVPPALLFVGNPEQTYQQAQKLLSHILCPSKGCGSCASCIQLKDKQHHATLWFSPKKSYTIDSLADLFATITFTLNHKNQFFFIIENADSLTPAIANKLLKPMEEPPSGYHFILLAQRLDIILPTIRSRCTIHTIKNNEQSQFNHQLISCFTTHPITGIEFQALMDTLSLNEYETIELLEAILNYWVVKMRKHILAYGTINQSIYTRIKILLSARRKAPMPGSSALFWKNLYVRLS